ncbi:hypothetical protein P691DRAFT_811878 [Macrolepiota fuliginosa MF-IS2]|uniref:Uncharacterized protein n=1 Tax=Macrolepiota fuliginosa MF-IS2 TaxID=1400762 RepID=A0A9P5X247_9AGAR|nr:hypothetical protein P691DRAFT_811878 [Macrolepiota fuliginosa MF-IS2]
MKLTNSAAVHSKGHTMQDTGLLALNDDILLTILQYCLPQDSAVEIPPSPQSQHLVLGQICHQLRWLLHAKSVFWSRFCITSTKLGQHRSLLKEWLSWTDESGSPVPVSIENREESKFSLPALEEFIFPYSSRLFQLRLYLTYDALEGLFTLLPPGAFPVLSDFWALCADFQQPSILGVEPVFLNSPLQEFALILGPPLHVRGLGISWASLKVLRLTTIQARFFFPISWIHMILGACRTSLETCFISLEPTTDPALPLLELPHLKTLSIDFRDSGWKTQVGILDFLSLPSLESLDLSSKDGLAFNEACTTLKSFLARSPNIQRLHFERTPAPGTGGHHTNIVVVLEAILLKKLCPLLESMELVVHNGLQVVKVVQVLWKEGAKGDKRSLKLIKLIDPKLSWIGICEPSAVEDPEITQGRRILQELEEEGLRIQT